MRLEGFRSRPEPPNALVFFFVFALMLGASPFLPSVAGADEHAKTELADASSPQFTAAVTSQNPTEHILELSNKTTSLVLSFFVNKEAKGDFFVERDRDGKLFIRVEDLVAMMLRFPRDRVVLINDEKYAPLSAVADISYTFDDKNLIVSILGKTTVSKKTDIELYSLQARPQNVYYPRETSAFFNYGLTYSYADPLGYQSFSLSNKIGARTGDLFFISDSLYTKTDSSEQFIRLSTNATYERRSDLQWLVFGDQFANSGDLGSSVNMGGVGFSKLYRLDPYFITQPLFNIGGVVEFPSEAEIYMDGLLVSKQPIAPGEFELKNVYSYTGSHQVEVVLKDPFGNEHRIDYPLYISTQLLREGLHEYSYNAGFLREQYGAESNEYGDPVFSTFHRYGVTSAFNIGARAEASKGVYNLGISTAFSMPQFGAIVLSAAGSSADNMKGYAGSFQHSYQLGSFNTNVQIRAYSRDYSTVGVPTSETMTKYSTSLIAGFQLDPVGSLSLGYSNDETHDGSATRIVSANYSRALTRTTSLFANVSSTRTDETVNAFYLGLSFSPAPNIHGSAQVSRTGETNAETLQLQKDTPIGEGVGYRASLSRSDTGVSTSSAFNPGLQYNARYGIYTLDSSIQNSNDATSQTSTASIAGALVYANGFYGFSRPVSDSFSIVMVDSLPNTTVLNNGQVIGTTDSSGSMVIPTLASYGQNQITLDVKNMPLDYSITGVNQQISPPIWSGSCVSFNALKVRAITGTLYLRKADKKTALEFVDISMKVGDKEVIFPTGKGGEFYMENSLPDDPNSVGYDKLSCRAIADRKKSGGNAIMPGAYQALVEYEGVVCKFSITFPDTEDAITDVGEVDCTIPEMPTPP
jgi:outer membrane usher protein